MARRFSTISLVILAVIQIAMAAKVPTLNEFFKSINGNLTKVTWKHAVNSKEDLQKALDSDVMMLEADVMMGHLPTNQQHLLQNRPELPIMSHPPAEESNLSLDEFLTTALNNRTKGLKLDFKSIAAFEEGLKIIEKHKNNITVPFWINADILLGPVNATNTSNVAPVEPKQFLELAKKTVPESILSVGWVTKYDAKANIIGNYTDVHIQAMLKTLKDNNVTQTVTYPVRAVLAMNDVEVMKSLLKNSHKTATLTIWSSQDDVVDGKKLSKLITDIGVDKVYVDVPAEVWKTLNLTKGGASYLGSSIVLTIVSLLSATFTNRIL